MANTDFQSVEEYIATFPLEVQVKLKEIRSIITTVAPQAEEVISYQMPTYKLNGNLVHFAGYKRHIGFYPAPSGVKAFLSNLENYKHAKGSIQFPLDQLLPNELIKKIVVYRVAENTNKASKK